MFFIQFFSSSSFSSWFSSHLKKVSKKVFYFIYSVEWKKRAWRLASSKTQQRVQITREYFSWDQLWSTLSTTKGCRLGANSKERRGEYSIYSPSFIVTTTLQVVYISNNRRLEISSWWKAKFFRFFFFCFVLKLSGKTRPLKRCVQLTNNQNS